MVVGVVLYWGLYLLHKELEELTNEVRKLQK